MGFPLPEVFARIAGASEFLGGLFLALGLLTRPAAVFVALTMAVARFVQHGSDPFGTGELALIYLVGAVALAFTGAGRFALDRIVWRRTATMRF
jgi:putative oxidoreductase